MASQAVWMQAQVQLQGRHLKGTDLIWRRRLCVAASLRRQKQQRRLGLGAAPVLVDVASWLPRFRL